MHRPDSVRSMGAARPPGRFLTVDQVRWPSLSLPTPKRDFVYCHRERGVFTSPDCPFPPPFPPPEPFASPESTLTAARDDNTLP